MSGVKVASIRLMKEPDKSFIVFHEKNIFSPWHQHPEFELVLIKKGRGKRMIGDHVETFEENDLLLLGPHLPHEWLCDNTFYSPEGGFLGEGIVIQFLPDFLGAQFFEIPENKPLKKVLQDSARGIKFSLKTKEKLIPLMNKIIKLPMTKQLYALFSIFKIISNSNDNMMLCSPLFMEPLHTVVNTPMQRAMQYILQNFQKDATIEGVLSCTKMSNTAFCKAFKSSYRMTFKEYLLSIRVGYACNLLTDENLNISEIAYNSGFENISNFNRQFKKIKGTTPSVFRQTHYNLKRSVAI
ncbi:MAG: AraC family transcriptional regulator [Mariniphaga sp.]